MIYYINLFIMITPILSLANDARNGFIKIENSKCVSANNSIIFMENILKNNCETEHLTICYEPNHHRKKVSRRFNVSYKMATKFCAENEHGNIGTVIGLFGEGSISKNNVLWDEFMNSTTGAFLDDYGINKIFGIMLIASMDGKIWQYCKNVKETSVSSLLASTVTTKQKASIIFGSGGSIHASDYTELSYLWNNSYHGSTARITAQKTGPQFNISIVHGLPRVDNVNQWTNKREYDRRPKFGQLPLFFEVLSKGINSYYIIKAYRNTDNKWFDLANKMLSDDNVFGKGRKFELDISIVHNLFQLIYNDGSVIYSFERIAFQMPLCSVNYLQIEGDIKLMAKPEFFLSPEIIEQGPRKTNFSMEIQQLQRFAAFIIDGRIPDNSKQFIIAFNKDTPEPAYDGDSGIGDTVFEATFKFGNNNNTLVLESYFHALKGKKKQSSREKVPENMLKRGEHFQLTYHIDNNRFILYNGVGINAYRIMGYYYWPYGVDKTINHIWFGGDVEILHVNRTKSYHDSYHGNLIELPVPLTAGNTISFKAPISYNFGCKESQHRFYFIGDDITCHGIPEIVVDLFMYGVNLSVYDLHRIGEGKIVSALKIVLWQKFEENEAVDYIYHRVDRNRPNATFVDVYAEYLNDEAKPYSFVLLEKNADGNEQKHYPMDKLMRIGDELSVNITVTEEAYRIELTGHNEPIIFHHHFPYWAVKFVEVRGSLRMSDLSRVPLVIN